MSGGSYNYLGDRAATGTVDFDGPDIRRMAERLAGMGPVAGAAAAETRALIDAYDELVERATKIAGVWHAVEWRDSSDWGDEQMVSVLNDYEHQAEVAR